MRDRLEQLQRRIADYRARSERFMHASPGVMEYCGTGLLRQRRYLLWTLGLSLAHILEIWILIIFHYAYPSHLGLTALRALSGLGLTGLIAALAFRWADADHPAAYSSGSGLEERLERLKQSARAVLSFGVLAAATVGIYLFCFSRLELSSPSAFRAVVVCGVLSLPVDITATFLLYLSGSVCALPVSRRLRWIAALGITSSLVLLAFDFPLLYLAVALYPRILLLMSAWQNTTGEKLARLFLLPAWKPGVSLLFWNSFKTFFARGLTAQIALDLYFLLMFNRLARADHGVALALYLVHKAAHLSAVLTGKTHLSLAGEVKAGLHSAERNRATSLLRMISILGAAFTLAAFVFVPIFLLQRQSTQWISHLGEPVSISPLLLGAALVLLLNRMVMNLSFSFSFYGTKPGRPLLALLLVSTALAMYMNSPALLQSVGTSQTFVFALIADVLIATILGARFMPGAAKEPGPAKSPEKSTSASLEELLQKISHLSSGNRTGTLFLATFFDGILHIPLQELLPTRTGTTVLVRWGPKALFILVETQSPGDLELARLTILEELAGRISGLQAVELRGRPTMPVLHELMNKRDPFRELYRLATGRQPTELSQSARRAANALQEWQQRGNSKTLSGRMAAAGLTVCPAEYGWDLQSIAEPAIRRLLRRFLSALSREKDQISPELSSRRNFRNILQVTRHGQPRLLIYLEDDKREEFSGLRFEIFRLNFADLLSGYEGLSSCEDPAYSQPVSVFT